MIGELSFSDILAIGRDISSVDSLAVLDACLDGIFEGYICDITLLNIDYIASKQSKDVKKFLELLAIPTIEPIKKLKKIPITESLIVIIKPSIKSSLYVSITPH